MSIWNDASILLQTEALQNEIVFTDVEIPEQNRIGDEGYGFIIAMKTFDRTRTGVAALSVGNARAAYETAKDFCDDEQICTGELLGVYDTSDCCSVECSPKPPEFGDIAKLPNMSINECSM